MGGRRHGQTQNQAELPSPSASASRFGSLQIGGAQQPRLTRLATRVRIRHRPIHRLVLLRASFGLQPHVVRYRMYLESRSLTANTINQQLAAVRRLAHEAADSGLLSPELAAGISRVKGVKQLGFRSGNWLSAEESSEVLKCARGNSMRAKRD